MSENKMQNKTGIVEKKLFGKKSKSEHLAYFLICEDKKEYVLQQQDANPFMNDFFEKYVGKKVSCKGKISDYILFVDEIKSL